MNRATISILIALSTLISACSSNDAIDTSTAEGAYKLAEEYRKDERFEESITYYSEIKNKHPYSRFAVLAELAIADIEFDRENFAISQTAYQVFKELHPTHEKSDYVTFRLGLSIFNQLPDSVDRDLTLAHSAILYFDEVLTTYSKSEYVEPAKKNKDRAIEMLQEKEMYIAEYYYKREIWLSALNRFDDFVNTHKGSKFDERAYYAATISALQLKDFDRMKSIYQRFSKNHPDSPELKKAQKEIENAD